ncbi:MAG TPA: hypothetical protein DDY78_23465 [Planctomycetales bacterium]|jgi:hypothetical protein|nr:hypothetical protein [Planctomycetales bacterium]
MLHKKLLAGLVVLAAVTICPTADGLERGKVVAVTADSIQVDDGTKTEEYKFSNELLTNTSHDTGFRGKITQLKPGCKIYFDSGSQDGQSVIIALEVRH